jgi:hypothetical protein
MNARSVFSPYSHRTIAPRDASDLHRRAVLALGIEGK